jgi:hypothetical protein
MATILAPAGHEIREETGLGVRQGPDLRRGRLHEVGDHGGVDGVRLGPLAQRIGEGADLGGIDDDHGQSRLGEARDDDRLEAARRFEPDGCRRESAQPRGQRTDAFGVARHVEAFFAGAFFAGAFFATAHVHVEAILRDVNADGEGDGFHCLPSLRKRASMAAQATVRVQWNGERGPKLPYGLGVPRENRPHARHRLRHDSRGGEMRVTRD